MDQTREDTVKRGKIRAEIQERPNWEDRNDEFFIIID